jgi:hypothetical protein
MPHLEPSYLRYIYDGLEKGDLHPDNSASLPEGLIGLYEAAFEENKPVRERQKLLETFSILALLKKEVSAQFVAEILEVSTHEIVDFIATYSSWFTSPESGKYQLYHERLKVYLLQKLSEQEIATLLNKLVTRLEQAIEVQKQDEFEMYGLEFLSLHYFTTAMITGDGKKLIALSYDQNHWQRQLKLSKGFEWTKKGLKQVMTWASKYNDEEVIECGLQMVDLHHQEQNDAPQIVALVAEGDIEVALKRIEAFGGNDKEGLQRKFTLYILCLMELTLLESKNKPFRKEAIEKILKHFDENIPVDHSLIDWNDFFSPYLLYLIAVEIHKFEFDVQILSRRTLYFERDWISSKGPYENKQFETLFLLIKGIHEEFRDPAISLIVTEYAKQNMLISAFKMVNEINYYVHKNNAFLAILKELKSTGDLKQTNTLFVEWIDSTKNILDEEDRNESFLRIAKELAILGKIENALNIIGLLNDNKYKDELYNIISKEYLKLRQFELATSIIYNIKDKSLKNDSYITIAGELVINGEYELAFNIVNYLNDKIYIDKFFIMISEKFIELGHIENALEYSNKILNENLKYEVIINISTEIARQGNIEEASKLIENIEKVSKDSFYYEVARKYYLQDLIEQCLISLNNIVDLKIKAKAIIYMSIDLIHSGSINKAESIFNKFLLEIEGVASSNFYEPSSKNSIKDKVLIFMTEELSNEGLIDLAITSSKKIKGSYYQLGEMLVRISIELTKKGKINQALKFISSFSDNGYNSINDKKNKSYLKIGEELANQLHIDQAINVISKITNYSEKNEALISILKILLKKGNVEKSYNFIHEIIDNDFKKQAFYIISNNLANNNLIHEAYAVLFNTLKETKGIDQDWVKSFILNRISLNYAKQGLINNLLITNNNIIDFDLEFNINENLLSIVKELLKIGSYEVSLNITKEITDELFKNEALSLIAFEYAKLGFVKESIDTINLISNNINLKLNSKATISSELYKFGYVDVVNDSMELVIKSVFDLPDDYFKIQLLIHIAKELKNQNQNEKSKKILDKAVIFTEKIDDSYNKHYLYISISNEFISYKLKSNAFKILNEAIKNSENIRDQLFKVESLITIALEFSKLEKIKMVNKILTKAIIESELISDRWDKFECFLSLNSTIKILKVKDTYDILSKALNIANQMGDFDKFQAYVQIIPELIRNELIEQALNITHEIYFDAETKREAYLSIINELLKLEKFDKAIEIAENINNNMCRNDAFIKIANEFILRQKYDLAYGIIQNLNINEKTKLFWEQLGTLEYISNGMDFCKTRIKNLPSNDSILFYKDGILNAQTLQYNDNDKYDIMSWVVHDFDKVALFLTLQSLHLLFFENLTEEKIQRFNRTLNIQWAIDIKNQLLN